MNDRPFFSIVVPAFNRSAQLHIALSSVLAQKNKNFEVIVVDDGSTDNTRAMVAVLQKTDGRIKYFFKENAERSIARNYGIAKACGNYVGFLDSDDIVYPNHLSVSYELLKRNGFPEVGHLGFEQVDSLGNFISARCDLDESFSKKLISENILHCNAIFIREDIAKKINFIPSTAAIISEDWYLWLKLASRFKFHFDNTVTSAVVQHGHRSLMNIDPDKLVASTHVVVEYLKMDIPFLKRYKNRIGYHFANHFTFLALTLALTRPRRWDTLKYLLNAMEYDPTVIFRKRFLASIKHFL